MDFIHSSLVKDRTAATEVLKVDLPTNPLSHLIITVDGYNVTDESTLAEIIGFINKVEITHRGVSIVSLESEDLYALNSYLYGGNPILTDSIATDNVNRALTLIVPFGRSVFNPEECYPGTKKGELTLSLDYTAPATSFDNAELNIEAVELIGASPSRYLKSTLLSVSAPGATGDNDVELPVGNDIVSLLLFNTTFPAASSHAYGIDNCKIMVDNVESGYASARAHCLVGAMGLRLSHTHHDIAAIGQVLPDNFYWLDFDPLKDDNFLLKTAGKSSVKIRLNMGVDEASKIVVVELVSV